LAIKVQKRGATMANLSELAIGVSVGLSVLKQRVLTMLALVMTFGLFCWSMALGQWIHFAIAGAFGLSIFLPVLWHEKPAGIPHEDER